MILMSAQKIKLTQLEAFKLQVKTRYSELSSFLSYKLNINCLSKLSSNPHSYYKYVMAVHTQQMTGSIYTFCLSPIQLSYFYISDAKQKITLTLEAKYDNTFCSKLGKKTDQRCSKYLMQLPCSRTTQREETPHQIKEVWYMEGAFETSYMINIPKTYKQPSPTTFIFY